MKFVLDYPNNYNTLYGSRPALNSNKLDWELRGLDVCFH